MQKVKWNEIESHNRRKEVEEIKNSIMLCLGRKEKEKAGRQGKKEGDEERENEKIAIATAQW